MVEVTERAAEALESLLNSNGAPQEAGIRILEDANSFTMSVDSVRDDDEVVWRNERPVLIAESRLAQSLTGHTIDFRTAADGRERFQLI